MNKIEKAALSFIVAGLLITAGNTVYANPIAYGPAEEMLSDPIFLIVCIAIVIIIVALIVWRIKKKKK